MEKMFSSRLLLCSMVIFALVTYGAAKKTKKLKITTESKPSDCSVLSENGDTLVVHYTGSLENGQVFDSSRERDPFTIQLGAGQVIKGWDQGLVGMCQGEIRKLVIPPHLGYGDSGASNVIPGGATLLFTVELMELQKKPLVKVPGSQFWVYLGLGAVVALIGYEFYRRGTKKVEEIDTNKTSTKRKGNKKRKERSKTELNFKVFDLFSQ
uniref:peptidylprolyl isomerase n=1 Tax=Suberites domuncula TaxID=55567 RepID=Q966Y5_SUBDO|nr:putative FK506-binding protein [Suberites domuncula]